MHLDAGGFLRGLVQPKGIPAGNVMLVVRDVLKSSLQREAFPYINPFPKENYPLLLGHLHQQQTFFLMHHKGERG